MSPARASLTSSRWLACINSMRPMRSRWFLTVLSTWSPAVEDPRIDADEGQRSDKRVGHDLESEAGERLVVRGVALDRLVGAHLDAPIAGDIGRRRQIRDDGVEQRLHALVLERRAAQHRDEGARYRALADAASQRLGVGLLASEIGLERGIVLLDRESRPAGCAYFRRRILHVGGDIDDVELGAQRLVAPLDRLHSRPDRRRRQNRSRRRSAAA